jgi:hypothetical protein
MTFRVKFDEGGHLRNTISRNSKIIYYWKWICSWNLAWIIKWACKVNHQEPCRAIKSDAIKLYAHFMSSRETRGKICLGLRLIMEEEIFYHSTLLDIERKGKQAIKISLIALNSHASRLQFIYCHYVHKLCNA